MTQSPLYNTQLLSVLHTMRQNLDKNIQMDMFYLDFAKAFDTVYHLNQQEWTRHDSTRFNVLLRKLFLYLENCVILPVTSSL